MSEERRVADTIAVRRISKQVDAVLKPSPAEVNRVTLQKLSLTGTEVALKADNQDTQETLHDRLHDGKSYDKQTNP